MAVKLVVTVLGIFLIILVNWYFLFSRKKVAKASIKKKRLSKNVKEKRNSQIFD